MEESICYNPFLLFGSIAQSVEQRTLNPRVTGSIPVRPTKNKGCPETSGQLFSYHSLLTAHRSLPTLDREV